MLTMKAAVIDNICLHLFHRSEMKRVGEGYMELSLVGSQQDISIPLGRKKVRYGMLAQAGSNAHHMYVLLCIGWTPSTFKSSRSDRAKAKAVRPEDFMDEEDLAELKDSQKLVDTTDEVDASFWERGRKKEIEVEGQECVS